MNKTKNNSLMYKNSILNKVEKIKNSNIKIKLFPNI